jgi:hypothetical protein
MVPFRKMVTIPSVFRLAGCGLVEFETRPRGVENSARILWRKHFSHLAGRLPL